MARAPIARQRQTRGTTTKEDGRGEAEAADAATLHRLHLSERWLSDSIGAIYAAQE